MRLASLTGTALWLVGCNASLAPLSLELERSLGQAAMEVTHVVRRFDRLRRELAQVPNSTLERLLAGLSASDVDLLNGQGDAKILEDRFQELQRQGQSLLSALRCESNALDEVDGFSLLEVPQDLEEDRREEEEDEELEEDAEEELQEEEEEAPKEKDAGERHPDVRDEAELDVTLETTDGSCLPARNVTGYVFTEISLHLGNFSVLAKCSEPSYTGEAEVLPCKAHLQGYQLRGCVDTRCSPAEDLEGYVITEGSLVYNDFDVSAACAAGFQGEAKVGCCQRPGAPYQLYGCAAIAISPCGNWSVEKVEAFLLGLQSLAKDLTKHFQLIASLSNVSSLPWTPAAQRASDMLAALRQAAMKAEYQRRQSALEVLRRLGAFVARLDPRSAEEEFQGIAEEAEKTLEQMKEEPPGPAAATDRDLGRSLQLSCDLVGIQRANERFDEAVSNFRSVVPKMLPREVESLHRVLHSLEVLRHTLQALPEPAECQRYFSGVEQLESDLAHYRSLFNPPAPAGAPSHAPRPKAVPLRPGQLEPLELDLGRGPLARPMSTTGAALDARGFR